MMRLVRIPIDAPLALVVLALAMFGAVMIGSASVEMAALQFDDPWHYFRLHAGYLVMALLTVTLVHVCPLKLWQKIILPMFVLILVGVLLVPIVMNGAIGLQYFGLLQPVEWLKPVMIVFLAASLGGHQENSGRDSSRIGFVASISAVLLVLIALEFDDTTALLLGCICVAMLFVAGAGWKILLPACVFGMGAILLSMWFDPDVHAYLYDYRSHEPVGAVLRGEWLGQGLGASAYKIFHLPDAHAGNLFAVLCEELGLAGSMAVMSLFLAMILCVMRISRRCAAHGLQFAALLAFGAALLLFLQAMINIAANIGLSLPNPPIIPLMGFDPQGLLVTAILLGFMFRASYESRQHESEDD